MKEHGVNFALTCVVLASLAAAAHATTVYVNCKGQTPNYTTIQAGVNAVATDTPPNTVVVCTGRYKENVVVNGIANVGENNIVVRANGVVTLSPGSGGTGSPGFTVYGTSVWINGFEISGFTGSAGIFVEPSTQGALIENNLIYGNGTGVSLSYSSGADVIGNVVYLNGADGIFDFEGYGDYIASNSVYANGGITGSPTSPGQNNGIEISTGSYGSAFSNIVYGNVADGVYFNGVQGGSIAFNQASSNGHDGIGLAGPSTGPSIQNSVSYNTANSNKNDGIEINSVSTSNTLTLNNMFGNRVLDAQDENGSNTWGNSEDCVTSSPSGLCAHN